LYVAVGGEVADEIAPPAETRRAGVEAPPPADDGHDVGDGLEGPADAPDLLAHEGQVAARIRADDQRARPCAHARCGAGEQWAVEHQALAEPVAQPPELLLVVQELPRQTVDRRADQERSRDASQLLAQPRRDERAVEHLAPGLCLLRE